MPNESAEITADGTGGLKETMIFVVGAADGSKMCTLMQMSQDPQLTGNGWNLQHNSGQFPYNPSNPNNAFANAPTYGIGDVVINMGMFIQRRFVIANERLTEIDNITGAVVPLVDQIIDLQAQYGIADVGGQQITHWCNATATSICGDWTNPTATDIVRVRALRIALVARSIQYEKEMVSPASLTLWGDVNAGDDDAAAVRALSDDQRHYRYKTYTTIVPIRNVIWGS
jgi:type IV pilus assembly protein PilW